MFNFSCRVVFKYIFFQCFYKKKRNVFTYFFNVLKKNMNVFKKFAGVAGPSGDGGRGRRAAGGGRLPG